MSSTRRQALCLVAALVASACRHPAPAARSGPRYVSLDAASTETLFAIGAGPQVVARTPYCTHPPEVRSLPSVGTILTPDFARLAEARPTRIFGSAGPTSQGSQLSRIAPTTLLRWKTVDEVLAGIRSLGRITDHAATADALAARIETRLRPRSPSSPVRVLLAFASSPDLHGGVDFIQRNSITGAALAAAGGRNAVDHDVVGRPTMDLDRLRALNPEAVLVVLPRDGVDPEERARYLVAWSALTDLAAVRRGAVRVIDCEACLSVGPRIVRVVDLFEAALRSLPAAP